MASLLSYARRLRDQINPFDGGKTWDNPNPAPQQARPMPVSQVQPLQRYQVSPTINTVQTPISMNSGVIKVGQDSSALSKQLNTPNGEVATPGQIGRELFTKPAARIGLSISDLMTPVQARSGSYTPGSKFEKALFGDESIKSYKAQYGEDRKKMGVLPAVGLGALTAFGDLPQGKAVKGVTIGLAKGSPKIAEKLATKVAPKAIDAKKAVKAEKVAKEIQNLKTNLAQGITAEDIGKLNWIDRGFRSTTSQMNKILPGSGTAVKAALDDERNRAARYAADTFSRTGLNTKQQEQMFDILEGRLKKASPEVMQAAEDTKKTLKGIGFELKSTTPEFKGMRKNYAPRMYDPKTFESGTTKNTKAIEQLIASGQAKNATEAQKILRAIDKEGRSPFISGNITKSRMADLPGYAKTNTALDNYFQNAAKVNAYNKAFGARGANDINKVLAKVGNVDDAAKNDLDRLFKIAMETERIQGTGHKVANALTGFQGATKLGVSSIMNSTQPIQTATVAGVGRTAKNYAKSFRKSAEDADFIRRTGVTGDAQIAEQLYAQTGITNPERVIARLPRGKELKLGDATAPAFSAVERKNREVAALTGRDEARSLAKKAMNGDAKALDRLRNKYKITGNLKKDGSLTKAQELQAGRALSDISQFRTRAAYLPAWTSTPSGKVIAQFRRYPYKQAEFMYNEVLKEAAKGNILPLVRQATLGSTVGVGANQLSDLIRGNDFENKTPEGRALGIVNKITSGDLLTSTLPNLNPRESYSADSYATRVGKTLGGPTVGDAINLIKAIGSAKDDKGKNLAREGAKHVPVVGTPTMNRIPALSYNNDTKEKASGSGSAKSTKALMSASDEEKAKSDEKEVKQYKEKVFGKDQKYGLGQLESGNYIYKVGDQIKTTSDVKVAKDAVARAQLKEDEARDGKLIGDTYYYKTDNGSVSQMPKYKYEYDKTSDETSLAMDIAKLEGNAGAFNQAANKQLQNLLTYREKVKKGRPGVVEEIDKKILALRKKFAGGVGGGGSGLNTSAFKTASKVEAPGLTTAGIKVRKLGGGSNITSGVKKLSVKKIPSNYGRKRLS